MSNLEQPKGPIAGQDSEAVVNPTHQALADALRRVMGENPLIREADGGVYGVDAVDAHAEAAFDAVMVAVHGETLAPVYVGKMSFSDVYPVSPVVDSDSRGLAAKALTRLFGARFDGFDANRKLGHAVGKILNTRIGDSREERGELRDGVYDAIRSVMPVEG